ncbi:hypothetical protein HED50_04670 [Ochrobactrum oryzae]|nr:hypothetical protein [Brucella oryzae]
MASLERLKAFLADGKKEIHKNGLSFDCAKIGKAIRISKHRLRQPPLVDLISEAEVKYEKELRAEGLTGFFMGEYFCLAIWLVWVEQRRPPKNRTSFSEYILRKTQN